MCRGQRLLSVLVRAHRVKITTTALYTEHSRNQQESTGGKKFKSVSASVVENQSVGKKVSLLFHIN
jgi:hypothetical protein